jgi:hypothetical protein
MESIHDLHEVANEYPGFFWQRSDRGQYIIYNFMQVRSVYRHLKQINIRMTSLYTRYTL